MIAVNCMPEASEAKDMRKHIFRDVPSISQPYEIKKRNKPTFSDFANDISFFFSKHKHKVIELLYEAESKGYESPTAESFGCLITAFKIVKVTQYGVKSYGPTQDGGTSFDMIFDNNKYLFVEFYNDGTSAILLEQPDAIPQGWDLSHEESLTKIAELIS